ncbi:MAG: peptidoglycan editing factor PgeF [Candidatus Aminicenantes bacterium]|nr:peptidoglycan editing factor PgeF [Candidatus Aminicenantes bacterium]
METKKKTKTIQVPRLKKLPFLVHGFGTKHLTEQYFNQIPQYKGFKKICLDQKHSNVVHCVKEGSSGILEGDGLVTAEPDILLVIKTADCLPVLIVDTHQRIIGAVHSGWRGTGRKILKKTLEIMKDQYSCQSSSLLAAMGPCICGKCYEVGEDVVGFFEAGGIPLSLFVCHSNKENKYFLDLKKANQLQLQEIGVGKDSVLSIDECTYCSPRLLSFRRNGQNNGRLLNFIGIESG